MFFAQNSKAAFTLYYCQLRLKVTLLSKPHFTCKAQSCAVIDIIIQYVSLAFCFKFPEKWTPQVTKASRRLYGACSSVQASSSSGSRPVPGVPPYVGGPGMKAEYLQIHQPIPAT